MLLIWRGAIAAMLAITQFGPLRTALAATIDWKVLSNVALSPGYDAADKLLNVATKSNLELPKGLNSAMLATVVAGVELVLADVFTATEAARRAGLGLTASWNVRTTKLPVRLGCCRDSTAV